MSVHYDPFSSAVHEDPYPIYQTLRNDCPVYHNEERGFWALSRFADVRSAARDWNTFSSARGVDFQEGRVFGPGNFQDSDPPRHDRLRKVVQRVFAPRNVRVLEDETRTEAKTLIESFLPHGEADLAEEFATPLPIAMMSNILGFPREDRRMLQRLLEAMALRTPDDERTPQEAQDAADELENYVAEVVRDRRKQAREDLISLVVRAEGENQCGVDETAGIVLILTLAGTETTASLMSNSLVQLEHHPDQRAMLARDPSAIPQAIEELLRYEPPIQNLARLTTRDAELHGVTIPKRAWVLLLHGSANRDERVFEDPDRLDVTRTPKRHLAFGEGVHHCIGSQLARLEARVAFEELLAHLPEYEIAGAVERLHVPTSRGISRLPVVFRSG